ncbi:MAG: ADP-ribosylglycohydrolase family protein, partial [Phycisphaerales bacterium]|nr:ADP-ribosylglycohydrolase family protein [Phycisphaerales bacterium]
MRIRPAIPLLVALGVAAVSRAGGTRELDREDYISRLHGMWLAENIANHTGLTTEGTYKDPPFLTDAAWGTNAGSNGDLIDFVFYDPWPADDDTDIEYIYLYLMERHGVDLSAEQISAGWIEHINRFIWVSNERARELIDRGVLPPMTGSLAANRFAPRIDAQLTTEMFGAIAPGMTGHALQLADLPIRTTSSSYAAHAAQFYAVLYSAAATVDHSLPLPDQVLSLVMTARAAIPDTSKTADICDYVLADFLDNPDPDDWERTRDRIYQRYQLLAADPWHGFPSPTTLGFRYRAWTESSVNFASGLLALLYGQGDLPRTIQIGTLSGWDADNPTATMGGLLGLMLGTDAVRD